MEFIKSNLKCVEIMQSSRTSYFLNTFGCVCVYANRKKFRNNMPDMAEDFSSSSLRVCIDLALAPSQEVTF